MNPVACDVFTSTPSEAYLEFAARHLLGRPREKLDPFIQDVPDDKVDDTYVVRDATDELIRLPGNTLIVGPYGIGKSTLLQNTRGALDRAVLLVPVCLSDPATAGAALSPPLLAPRIFSAYWRSLAQNHARGSDYLHVLSANEDWCLHVQRFYQRYRPQLAWDAGEEELMLQLPGEAAPDRLDPGRPGAVLEELVDFVCAPWQPRAPVPENPGRWVARRQDAAPAHRQRKAFLDAITESFAADEVRNLYFYLGLDYESRPDTGKEGKVRELITHLWLERRLADLIEGLRHERPEIDWPDASEVALLFAAGSGETQARLKAVQPVSQIRLLVDGLVAPAAALVRQVGDLSETYPERVYVTVAVDTQLWAEVRRIPAVRSRRLDVHDMPPWTPAELRELLVRRIAARHADPNLLALAGPDFDWARNFLHGYLDTRARTQFLSILTASALHRSGSPGVAGAPMHALALARGLTAACAGLCVEEGHGARPGLLYTKQRYSPPLNPDELQDLCACYWRSLGTG